MPADAGEVDGEAQEVGAARERRERPGEGQGEVELVRRLLVVGQQDDGVLEGQQDPGVDVEREMQVERPAAPLLGVQVDLPDLAQRVRLDEVPLVVHVEPVVDGMVFQVGDVAGDVDGSHSVRSLMGADRTSGRRADRRASLYGERVDDARLLEVLDEAVVAVRAALDDLEDWGPTGTTPGAVPPRRGGRRRRAADPARGGPGRAVGGVGALGRRALGLARRHRPDRRVDECAPGRAVLFDEHLRARRRGASRRARGQPGDGTRYAAARGGGAERDGRAIAPSGCDGPGWRHRRHLGLPGPPPRLGAVPGARCGVARVLRRRRGRARRLPDGGAEHALRLGLPGRPADLPGGRRDRGRARGPGPRSCATTPAGGPSWPRPRNSPGNSGKRRPCDQHRHRAPTTTRSLARKTWRTLEPLHGMIYFVPEAAEAYARLGITGRTGYFASRAAPMGAVGAEVVIATFFNFNPELVRHAIPAAWDLAHARAARRGALRRGRRGLPAHPGRRGRRVRRHGPRGRAGPHRGRRRVHAHRGPPARRRARGARLARRTAPRPLARPVDPARVPRRRPHRPTGRARAVGARVARDPRRRRRRPRRRSSSPPGPGASRTGARRQDGLRQRGWLEQGDELRFTATGAQRRQQIEDGTDALAAAPYAALGDERCAELRALVRPWSKAFAEHLR